MREIKYSSFFRLFGIILFIYILSRIDISELMTALKNINLVYYLIGILFLILGFSIRVLRWKILTQSVGAGTSFKNLAEISARGVFLGFVTPGKLGEFWKAKYLAEDAKVAGGRAFYSAFMDKVVDLLVTGTVGLLGIMIICLKFRGVQDWELAALIFLSFITLTYFLIWKKGIQRLLKILIKFLIPSILKKRANSFLDEFYRGCKSLDLKLFFKILIFGFLYYFFAGAVVHYFITLALGISVPFWYLFLIVAIAWLAAVIPVTILGLGTREAAFIYFFSLLGISPSSAVALSLLALFSSILIIGLPGAILFLKQK